MNYIWNKNIAAFKNRFPQLAELYADFLNDEPNADFWTVETARSGDFTAIENGIRLHSSYNPQREAQQSIANSGANEKSGIVFYGFGLGWHVVEWAKEFGKSSIDTGAAAGTRKSEVYSGAALSTKKLILIEPDPTHFFAALKFLDWESVFKIPQLIIALSCPPEQLLPLLENTTKINLGNEGVSDLHFFAVPAFMNHAKPYFDSIIELVARNKRKNEINAATLKKFGKLWTNNSLKNLEKMAELDGIEAFKGMAGFVKNQFQEPGASETSVTFSLPFLILGAGPSLADILPHLKELQKRFVTVCVETALPTLLRHKIQPDFIILTDPQFWAYKHIAGTSAPESILITEISVYPDVFRYDCKKIILCSSQFTVGQYFEKKLGIEIGNLGTGGSVASAAWNFAEYCGAKEIFTAGLDLGFPKNQTHIKGSSAEQTFHTIANKLSTVDKLTAATLFSAGTEWQKDFAGTPILTDTRMKMFAWWFESRIAACPHVKTYTLCSQSLAIPEITPVNVENALCHPEIAEEKKIFLECSKKTEHFEKRFAAEYNAFKKDKTEFLNEFPWMKEFV
ncbi:MAG: DUF115 domain-containing protein [Treponema sp.]|nr:DUF115 domain-containing protein [Treponema sp.]